MITKFRGEYAFLSNFYNAEVKYDGLTYLNNESAFQAQKCVDLQDRNQFINLQPKQAKHLGKIISIRNDWDDVKNHIMYEICLAKFTQHPDLKCKLIGTMNKTLLECNDWGDTYWGICNGVGYNYLGKILMQIRTELKLYNCK